MILYAKILAGISTAAGVGICMAPHTIFINQHREENELKVNKVPILPSPKLQSLIKEVLNDIDVTNSERKNLSFYIDKKIDFSNAGFPLFFSKGFIGIPPNFNFTHSNDFKHENFQIDKAVINWDSWDGVELEDSLILSDNAKKFALAQNIWYQRLQEPLINSICSSFCGVGLYLYYKKLPTKTTVGRFIIKIDPKMRSIFNLCGCLVVGVLMYTLCLRFACFSHEVGADSEVAKLGTDYIRGGAEYYDKLIKRNLTLKTIHDDKESKIYSETGNFEVNGLGKPLQRFPVTIKRILWTWHLDELAK